LNEAVDTRRFGAEVNGDNEDHVSNKFPQYSTVHRRKVAPNADGESRVRDAMQGKGNVCLPCLPLFTNSLIHHYHVVLDICNLYFYTML